MANYIETFDSKMDWANVFVRTGDFPLDRSSIFSSYDDAVLYAAGTGKDSRGLGKTSYIGQIITVYEEGKVDVYKIGENRNLEHISDEDDIANIINSMPIVKGDMPNSAVLKGGNNQAISEGEVALGVYNKSNADTRFSIGVGTSETDRKNAFEVKQNGDVYIKGITLPLATLLSTADTDADVESVWKEL